MLKITVHATGEELRFTLEGKLAGPWVPELRECWRQAASERPQRGAVVDLREVDFVDSEGQAALADLRRAGARFLASTPVIQAVVREICRSVPCATVEEKTGPRQNAAICPDKSGPDPRAL